MAKKRKTLPSDMREIIDSGDMKRFKAVFDHCELSATNRGATTENVFSYRNLTRDQIWFLAEQGMDLNADAGFGKTPAAYLADNAELLDILIWRGADINHAASALAGNALFCSAVNHRVRAVENLLARGADPESRGGFGRDTALDAALQSCSNIELVKMVPIAKALLEAGARPTDRTRHLVTKLGETFEFHRSSFNRDYLGVCSDALEELYALFQVDPVPRRTAYDGSSPIVVRGKTWQEQFSELWNLLVPGSGPANTVQGEVIRVLGRITHELLDNGGGNWDREYQKMAAALPGYFRTAGGETAEKACDLAQKLSAGSDKALLYALTELAVRWVLENDRPIALGAVEYQR